MKKLQVLVDFQGAEQEALSALCAADYRLPTDQIRWMVIVAAQQRGLLQPERKQSTTQHCEAVRDNE